jgi:hypothetical protein
MNKQTLEDSRIKIEVEADSAEALAAAAATIRRPLQ